VIVVHYLPVYWGVETEAVDHTFLTRSTLHEVLPPFRMSVWAFRIRVSHKHYLHVGKFKYDDIAAHWGMNTPVELISQWRGPNAFQQEVEASADPAPVSTGQVE